MIGALLLVLSHWAPDPPRINKTWHNHTRRTQCQNCTTVSNYRHLSGSQTCGLGKSSNLQTEIVQQGCSHDSVTRSAYRAVPLWLKWDWETFWFWCHVLTLDLARSHHSPMLSHFTSYRETMREWKNRAVPWMQPIPPECCAIGRVRVILPVLEVLDYPLDLLALFLLEIPLEM